MQPQSISEQTLCVCVCVCVCKREKEREIWESDPKMHAEFQSVKKIGVVVPVCNLSTWEAEAGGSQVQG
jgi:hypothetical protein